MTTIRYVSSARPKGPPPLLPLIALTLILPLLPLCLMALTAFRRAPAHRSFEITPDGLTLHRQPISNHQNIRETNFTPSPPIIPWDRVTKLYLSSPIARLERPSPEGPANLRIEYIRPPPFRFLQKTFTLPGRITFRPGARIFFHQTLAQPAQTDLLRRELDRLRQTGQPVPPLKTKNHSPSLPRLWPAMLAVFLLLHGLPLLSIGLQHLHDNPTQPATATSSANHRLGAKLAPFLTRHFHTTQSLTHFYLFTGALLTLTAAILSATTFLPTRRQKHQTSNPISDAN